MSRMERLNKTRVIKKTVVYPSLIFLGCMILLLLLVDYRVNDSLGMKKIQIVNVKKQSDSKFQLEALGCNSIVIDTAYIKKDYKRLKNHVNIMTQKLKISAQAFIQNY